MTGVPLPRTRKWTLAGRLAVVWGVVSSGGCTDSEMPTTVIDEPVRLQTAGFPPFAQSEAVFELWISFAPGRRGAATSVGRFVIDGEGQIVGTDYQPITFAVDAQSNEVPTDESGRPLWDRAAEAFVTLEPDDDPDPGPTLPALIAGSFANGSALLDVAHPSALDRDFSTMAGSYHLATPTTLSTADESEGIWFATPGGGSPSLLLPDLPPGWFYEGWISLTFAGARSLGRFSSPSGTDSNGWGPPGDAPGYPFPGHDFPWGASVDFSSGTVFVTLEPGGNFDGPGPLPFLELLGASVPATPGSARELQVVASFPTATVTVPISR